MHSFLPWLPDYLSHSLIFKYLLSFIDIVLMKVCVSQLYPPFLGKKLGQPAVRSSPAHINRQATL